MCGWTCGGRHLTFSPIVDDYRNLLYQIPMLKLSHCYKEAKFCAYTLTRKAVQMQQNYLILDTLPVE